MHDSPTQQHFRGDGNAGPAARFRKHPPDRDDPRAERERLVDEELDDTFPASDPPSWTMGGSHVGTLRH